MRCAFLIVVAVCLLPLVWGADTTYTGLSGTPAQLANKTIVLRKVDREAVGMTDKTMIWPRICIDQEGDAFVLAGETLYKVPGSNGRVREDFQFCPTSKMSSQDVSSLTTATVSERFLACRNNVANSPLYLQLDSLFESYIGSLSNTFAGTFNNQVELQSWLYFATWLAISPNGVYGYIAQNSVKSPSTSANAGGPRRALWRYNIAASTLTELALLPESVDYLSLGDIAVYADGNTDRYVLILADGVLYSYDCSQNVGFGSLSSSISIPLPGRSLAITSNGNLFLSLIETSLYLQLAVISKADVYSALTSSSSSLPVTILSTLQDRRGQDVYRIEQIRFDAQDNLVGLDYFEDIVQINALVSGVNTSNITTGETDYYLPQTTCSTLIASLPPTVDSSSDWESLIIRHWHLTLVVDESCSTLDTTTITVSLHSDIVRALNCDSSLVSVTSATSCQASGTGSSLYVKGLFSSSSATSASDLSRNFAIMIRDSDSKLFGSDATVSQGIDKSSYQDEDCAFDCSAAKLTMQAVLIASLTFLASHFKL